MMLIGIIIIIVISIFYLLSCNGRNYENYLYGHWCADDDHFCEESGIQSMELFIGEPESGWLTQTRPCYLIIMNDMCNQALTLTYRTGWAPAVLSKYKIRCKVEFDSEQIWPDHVDILVDMKTGKMKIYNDDTVYAKLTKNNELTNMSRV